MPELRDTIVHAVDGQADVTGGSEERAGLLPLDWSTKTMPKARGAERAWPFCLMRSLTTHRSNLNNFVQLISGAVWSDEIVAAAVCHHRASRDTIADELAQPAACRTVGRARVVKRGPFGSTRSGVAREGWTSPHCRSSTSNEGVRCKESP